MACILVADEQDGVTVLKRLLAADHELTVGTDVRGVVALLKERQFDLIIIGVYFDDSRMFDLMAECKKIPSIIDVPIICFCTRDTPLTRIMHASVEVSAKALGAWMYLDQHEYNVKRNPDAELRRVIERCLVSTERKKIQDHRADIQIKREELLELRQALDAEEWTVDLEDRVAEFRQKLSEVLLELSKVQLNSVTQHEKLSQSRDLDDRVSQQVKTSEHDMARKERELSRAESQQLAKEQEFVSKEEAKSKKGRKKLQDDKVKD